MAYTEAEILAGGLVHIPVLIGVLMFINNITRSRQRNFANEAPKSFAEATQTADAERLQAKAQANKDLEAQAQVQAKRNLEAQAKAQSKLEAKAQAEDEKRRSESELEARLQAEAERLEAQSALKAKLEADAKRLETEEKQIVSITGLNLRLKLKNAIKRISN